MSEVSSQGLMSSRHGSVFEKGVRLLISQNFKDWPQFKVIEENKKYPNAAEIDAHFWAQKTGKMPKIVEVWLAGNYVCDVYESEPPEKALKRIMSSLIMLKKTLEERAARVLENRGT